MLGRDSWGYEILRETLNADAIGLAKDGRPLDDIAQLSDIARPGVLFKSLKGLFGESR